MTPNLFADVSPFIYLPVLGAMAIAGLAIFAGLVLAGLWIAKRMRAKDVVRKPSGSEEERPT